VLEESEVLIKHSLWMISHASLYFIAARCCYENVALSPLPSDSSQPEPHGRRFARRYFVLIMHI